MKKTISIMSITLLMLAVMMLGSCSNETLDGLHEQETSGWHSAKVKFCISRDGFDQNGSGTRAASGDWQDGDVVHLLLTKKDGKKVQAYVKYDGDSQSWGDVIYDGFKSDLTCNTERVVEAYYLEGQNSLASTISLNYQQAVYACKKGTYIYPSDGDMTVNVNLEPFTGRIRFKGKSGTMLSVCDVKICSSFSPATGEFRETTSVLTPTVDSNGYTPYIYCSFSDIQNPSLYISTDNTYQTVFDPSSSVLQPGKSGFLDIPTAEDHRGWKWIEYVDLGLSVKWATCNIGASYPEEYGDYYAWGETETKSTYDWSTYKWCNGTYDSMTKYCTKSSYGTVDNKTQLDLADDVAYVKWGGSWRMPTKAEQDELRENCTWTWTTQGGKDGYKVTSRKNGNSIFLPAAGYRSGSDLGYAGSYGYYWSSSLSVSYSPSAYDWNFYFGNVAEKDTYRIYGQSVRAVCP